ncbi:pentatricopeptide repeat (PPR) superfamily protein [Striga asiatica]|uniref:Pentatricopeptide repeat (PPR) superfamily protein n=1 Tax=Striga asiatica TaxID=4170 RepID=A0A5A7PHA3_STRAF|nr:pentatricopeptide repeat (PPR) superfamily protein [Striga asiatica]
MGPFVLEACAGIRGSTLHKTVQWPVSSCLDEWTEIAFVMVLYNLGALKRGESCCNALINMHAKCGTVTNEEVSETSLDGWMHGGFVVRECQGHENYGSSPIGLGEEGQQGSSSSPTLDLGLVVEEIHHNYENNPLVCTA